MNLLKRENPLQAPVKVLQFGEGNFLRAFIDWMIQEMNDKCDFNAAVQLVQPIEKGMADMINAQDGLYFKRVPRNENAAGCDRKLRCAFERK